MSGLPAGLEEVTFDTGCERGILTGEVMEVNQYGYLMVQVGPGDVWPVLRECTL